MQQALLCGSNRNIIIIQTSFGAAACADICEYILRHVSVVPTTRKGNHVSFQGLISIYCYNL